MTVDSEQKTEIEKKRYYYRFTRALGVTLIAWGLLFLVNFRLWNMLFPGSVESELPAEVAILIFALPFIVTGVGLYKFKRWAWFLALCALGFIFITCSYGAYQGFPLLRDLEASEHLIPPGLPYRGFLINYWYFYLLLGPLLGAPLGLLGIGLLMTRTSRKIFLGACRETAS